ncbi:flagellar motor protein MotB [Porcipelethomonas sp.]|uniref:flagellar motor protein MotB n=1 Tax=Porcipelethomonas sp. TaxID=2981675 RepID=UPI003EF12AB6
MAKKNRDEGGANWMDTYGDMVTLLLTFFVMLYSMSSVSEEKWAKLVKAFSRYGDEEVEQIVIDPDITSNGEYPFDNTDSGLNLGPSDDELSNVDMDSLYIEIQQFVEDHQMEDSISVRQGDEDGKSAEAASDESSVGSVENPYSNTGKTSKNIYIQFKNNVLFMPDESVLKEDSGEVMDFLGECLQKVNDDVAMIIIKGHTADAPSSVVDSRILSSERASTISNFLENKYKIPSTKLYPIGLAGDYPIATNENEEGRNQNRRVEIVIIGKDSDLAKSGELLKILGASFDTGEADIEKIAGD